MLSDITNNSIWRQSVITRNHAYLSLDTKDSFIRPAIISFSNNIQEKRQCSTAFIQSKDTSKNTVHRPPLTTRNHAYLCVDIKDRTIRPAIISFPNNIQQNMPCSYEFIYNQAFAANEDTTANVWRRKNTHPSLVARAEEALSSRTVNTDRKRKNTNPLLAISPQDALFTRSIRRRYTPATSNIHCVNTNRNSPSTNFQNLNSNTAHARNDTPSYMDLDDCDQQCRHYGCLFWYNERLKGAHYTREAEYHLCCGGGQIYMPPTPDPPAFIQQLFKNNQFMEHIRAYNQMFAMTSFGAKIDHSVNKGRGPYVFKISGQIYHWIRSLCPEEGHHSCFLQLYVYDTRDELSNRIHHFGGLDKSTLNPKIVEGLIQVLDEHNGLVRLFRIARDRCNAGDIPSFKIRLYNMGGVRGYEQPTADVLGQ
ncbi:hypothetical protein Tco_1334879 [Tanacetum coccineum]